MFSKPWSTRYETWLPWVQGISVRLSGKTKSKQCPALIQPNRKEISTLRVNERLRRTAVVTKAKTDADCVVVLILNPAPDQPVLSLGKPAPLLACIALHLETTLDRDGMGGLRLFLYVCDFETVHKPVVITDVHTSTVCIKKHECMELF